MSWTRSAERALRRLPKDAQSRIRAAVRDLADDPRPSGVSKMKGPFEGFYRMRVGIHYRVVYEINDEELIIVIVRVGSRENIY